MPALTRVELNIKGVDIDIVTVAAVLLVVLAVVAEALRVGGVRQNACERRHERVRDRHHRTVRCDHRNGARQRFGDGVLQPVCGLAGESK